MKKLILALSISCTCSLIAHSQFIPGLYVPENHFTNFQKPWAFRKTLMLDISGSFRYNDLTSGSCWAWNKVSGKWHVNKDTLILNWQNALYPDSTILITKYLQAGSKLVYADPGETNSYRNWGNFVFLKRSKPSTSAKQLQYNR